MIEQGTANPESLAWHLAEGMIREFLPESRFEEEIVDLKRGDPGRLETNPKTGHRLYWFRRCPLRVRQPDGEERERIYSFRFDWSEGRWQIWQVPAVCN